MNSGHFTHPPQSQLFSQTCLRTGRKSTLGEADNEVLGKFDGSFSLFCNEHMNLPLKFSFEGESSLEKAENSSQRSKESRNTQRSYDVKSDFPLEVL